MLSWYGIPEELSEPEKAFMKEHGLAFSSGYIGMLRCYKGNRTVWQSSSAILPVACVALAETASSTPWGSPPPWPGDDELRECAKSFLKEAMSMPPAKVKKALEKANVPLF